MVVTMMLAPSAVHAQKTKTIEGGRTTVALAGSFVEALDSLGVTPGTVSPTKLYNGQVNFPVTGGAIDLDTAAGQILHSGGLTFTAGKIEVTLQSFIIDTTSTPVISGLVSVNGKLLGRARLFDLILPSGFTVPLKPHEGQLVLKDVGVELDKKAADTLNSVYHVSAFTAGFKIGTAKVVALLSEREEDED